MRSFQRQIALRVVGIHAAIIFLMVAIPALRGCFKPKPKELVTFIEFAEPAAAVSVETVAWLPEPAAAEPPPPELPESIPEPPKRKVLEAKPKEMPQPKSKPKPKVQKPKWKPTSAKDIKIGKRIESKPAPSALSAKDIEKALSGITSSSSRSAVHPNAFNAYYAQVRNLFYGHWQAPASSGATGATVVKVSFRKNGQISKRAKISSSGDALYDRTVMDAVNAISMLPRPPSDYPYDYVEVEFALNN